jgi:hypothetical protein
MSHKGDMCVRLLNVRSIFGLGKEVDGNGAMINGYI